LFVIPTECSERRNPLVFNNLCMVKPLGFNVTKEVLNLGVKVITARIIGVNNSEINQDFEIYKNEELENIKKKLTGKNYKDDPILQGFRDLHTKVGRSNRDYVASPEGLRRLFLERSRFPHINTVVDIYNLVSLKSGLALGAHDVDKIQGNVKLCLTKGDEIFIPLGADNQVAVFPGEYCYVDDGNNVICRLEVLQVEPTKITTSAQDIFIIVEGNANTSFEYVAEMAKEVCTLIKRYCGGDVSFFPQAAIDT